jgi:hypothetical protein
MDVYSFQGGIRVGESYWLAKNATVPLVTLRITAGALYFYYPFAYKEVKVPREMIDSIYKKWSLLGPGIRIIHHAEDVPPFIIFWTYRPREVLRVLIDSNYPVKEKQETSVSNTPRQHSST